MTFRGTPLVVDARAALAALALLAGVGCPSKPGAPPDGSAEAGPADGGGTDASASAKDPLDPIPPWAPDRATAPCFVRGETRTALRLVAKGADVNTGNGVGASDRLVKELGGDTCFAVRAAIATALLRGGRTLHLEKKNVTEAARYLREALVVRPSFAVARIDLADYLIQMGRPEDAVAQIGELARGAAQGDASAMWFLEKARSLRGFERVRENPAFVKALAMAGAHLDPALDSAGPAKKAIALLPRAAWRTPEDKPAVAHAYAWKPSGASLAVAAIIDDPAHGGDLRPPENKDWAALAVYRLDDKGEPSLLTVRPTAATPPVIAPTSDGKVLYSYDAPCGRLSGVLTWNGKGVDVRETTCADLP